MPATLQKGQQLPDFSLKIAAKDGVEEFRLSEHLGDGPIVFAFFPLAFTGGCEKEVCDFRDNLEAFKDLNAKVIGISTDHHFANQAFAKHNDLPFGLLCDPNRQVVPQVWETMEVAGVKDVAKRGAMVVGADGTVLWSWASDDPKVWVGTEEVAKHLPA